MKNLLDFAKQASSLAPAVRIIERGIQSHDRVQRENEIYKNALERIRLGRTPATTIAQTALDDAESLR